MKTKGQFYYIFASGPHQTRSKSLGLDGLGEYEVNIWSKVNLDVGFDLALFWLGKSCEITIFDFHKRNKGIFTNMKLCFSHLYPLLDKRI